MSKEKTYYQELKDYGDQLVLWKRINSWSKSKNLDRDSVLNIHENHTKNKVDRSCPVCVGRALTRAANYYIEEKKKYSKRFKKD